MRRKGEKQLSLVCQGFFGRDSIESRGPLKGGTSLSEGCSSCPKHTAPEPCSKAFPQIQPRTMPKILEALRTTPSMGTLIQYDSMSLQLSLSNFQLIKLLESSAQLLQDGICRIPRLPTFACWLPRRIGRGACVTRDARPEPPECYPCFKTEPVAAKHVSFICSCGRVERDVRNKTNGNSKSSSRNKYQNDSEMWQAWMARSSDRYSCWCGVLAKDIVMLLCISLDVDATF